MFYFVATCSPVTGENISTLPRQLTRGSITDYSMVSPTSPGRALQRKSSQRITAKEGSRILDKFLHRANTQDTATIDNGKNGIKMYTLSCKTMLWNSVRL